MSAKSLMFPGLKCPRFIFYFLVRSEHFVDRVEVNTLRIGPIPSSNWLVIGHSLNKCYSLHNSLFLPLSLSIISLATVACNQSSHWVLSKLEEYGYLSAAAWRRIFSFLISLLLDKAWFWILFKWFSCKWGILLQGFGLFPLVGSSWRTYMIS